MFFISFAASILASIPMSNAQTLEKVRERGFLICAASNSISGFSSQTDEGVWTGFDVDICRAVAAATLGDPDLVEFRLLSGDSRFAQLQAGEIDLLARNASWTMSRDTRFGVRYVTTSFFDGQSFMVRADQGFVSAFELTGLSICVVNSGDDLTNMRKFFFANQAENSEKIYEDLQDLMVAYSGGMCDAISAPASFLQSVRRTLNEPGVHRIMPEYIS
ncbi:MAG: transporter substrate-binding domain-containing protein, partial [Devosiaceae bacterium]|nr:transporter substrate-binding domain-containing protein [Devosiaceae bacterium]